MEVEQKCLTGILTKKHKAAIKSYLRAVAASGITVALAIVADIHPAYATLLGAVVAHSNHPSIRC